MSTELYEVTEKGEMRLNLHLGQWQAWLSQRRIVAVLAGTQGGKTSFGPHWLLREITLRGAGDYFVVTPTFTILELKALPEFLKIFKELLNLGTYKANPTRRFTLSRAGEIKLFGVPQKVKTNVHFGYAANPDSLESATAKAAWLDEAGQKTFKAQSFEAILRRLSLARGRILITTTPYDLGFLKKRIYDRWLAGDADIDLIRFDSTENPNFSSEEFERARNDLPLWKFNLFYRAIFSRPAGMIYDCFKEKKHKISPFELPDHWSRFVGLDFGAVNTAAVFVAQNPETLDLFVYNEYKAAGRTAAEHTKHLLKIEPKIKEAYGGSGSEDQWRREFSKAGLYVKEPVVSLVEVGIDRVYGAIKRNELFVFDTCKGFLDEKLSYSRKLTDTGDVLEEIDNKSSFHFLDAERYIVSALKNNHRDVEHGDSIF